MKHSKYWPRGMSSRRALSLISLFALGLVASLMLTSMAGAGAAATPDVSLHTAQSFAILAGTDVTDVPTSAIKGDVGLSPATGAGIGLGCGEVNGKIYSVDAAGPLPCRLTNPGLVGKAQSDLTSAYGDAAGRTPDTTFGAGDNQLGGQVLVPGVYRFGHGSTANLIGTLTLDAANNPDAVWIFQASSDLVTASSSRVALIRGAQACHVYWQVSSSATLGTSSSFVGTILALTSISVTTGVTIDGRVLARNAAVTLDKDTITRSGCSTAPPTTSTTTTTAATTTAPPPTTSTPTTTATTTAPTSTATTTVAAVTLSGTPTPVAVKPPPKAKPPAKKPAAKKPAAKPAAPPKRVPAARPHPVAPKHPVGLTG